MGKYKDSGGLLEELEQIKINVISNLEGISGSERVSGTTNLALLFEEVLYGEVDAIVSAHCGALDFDPPVENGMTPIGLDSTLAQAKKVAGAFERYLPAGASAAAKQLNRDIQALVPTLAAGVAERAVL